MPFQGAAKRWAACKIRHGLCYEQCEHRTAIFGGGGFSMAWAVESGMRYQMWNHTQALPWSLLPFQNSWVISSQQTPGSTSYWNEFKWSSEDSVKKEMAPEKNMILLCEKNSFFWGKDVSRPEGMCVSRELQRKQSWDMSGRPVHWCQAGLRTTETPIGELSAGCLMVTTRWAWNHQLWNCRRASQLLWEDGGNWPKFCNSPAFFITPSVEAIISTVVLH